MKRSAIGVFNGNWKGGRSTDESASLPLSLNRELEISLDVAKGFTRDTGERQDRVDELTEQLRVLEAITPEAHADFMASVLAEFPDEREATDKELVREAETFPDVTALDIAEQAALTYGQSELKSDAIRDEWMGEFEGYPVREILSQGFAFNSKRMDIYQRYCKRLAESYNSKFE